MEMLLPLTVLYWDTVLLLKYVKCVDCLYWLLHKVRKERPNSFWNVLQLYLWHTGTTYLLSVCPSVLHTFCFGQVIHAFLGALLFPTHWWCLMNKTALHLDVKFHLFWTLLARIKVFSYKQHCPQYQQKSLLWQFFFGKGTYRK